MSTARFLCSPRKLLPRVRRRPRIGEAVATPRRPRRVHVETLESRRLLALLGVSPGLPVLTANNTGTVSFDADTGAFVATAEPLTFKASTNPFAPGIPVGTPREFMLQVKLDSAGNLVGGAPGTDFEVSGEIDIDGDGTIDVAGLLLSGEVVAFGFQDSGSASTTDNYDFRIQVTGGALATAGPLSGGGTRPNYFSNADIGLLIRSEMLNGITPFSGSFTTDFGGGNKATLGPVEELIEPAIPAIDIEKCVEYVVAGPGQTHVIDFTGLAAGTVVDDEYSSLGVTISAQNANASHPDKAIVFDSANPTGGDTDLATPGYHPTNTSALGNLLVIAENDVDNNSDQLIDVPDDEARGGTLRFDFDSPVRIDQVDLLDVDSAEVGGSVVTVTTSSGSQSFQIAALGDNSFQSIAINVDEVTSLSVNFISSGAISGLQFTKPSESIECDDADVGPGPSFSVGDAVTFNYTVTNPGEVDLLIVEVSDDNATPGNPGDDFHPTPVLQGGFNVGDTDQDGELDLTEAWQYTYTVTAATVGQFTNISDVLGNPVDNPDVDVVDDDPANYVVVGDPGIAIEKFTNGVDAEVPSQGPLIAPGETVTWTYEVTNSGQVPFAADEIEIVDDNGTPAVTADDFGTGLNYGGSEIVYLSGDDGDGILSPGETWTYVATGTALQLAGGPVGPAIVFDFAGNSSTDGADGNTRSYSAGGVDVDVRGFSRDKSSGAWAPAYVGSYGGGLGVTDSSEGNGGSNTHTVDNVGRDNYVLFEFSESVVIDAAYLGYVVDDSDLTVWIGNASTPLSGLSDAVLSGLGFTEINDTTSSAARWANLNAGEVSGNVLVIAASTSDSTPEDRFKIEHVKLHRTAEACYENIAVVTAGAATDSDASYYCNPETFQAAIDVEKFVKVVTGTGGGGEGLTPGFWKTHSQFGPAPLAGWPDTAYSPLDDYETVFGVSDTAGLTLLDALGRGGGGTNALGRHATAALLNASNPNVDYAFTVAEIISLTQQAYQSGDASLIESTKNSFAVQNELGADLSTPANAPDTGTGGFGDDADTGPGPAAMLGDEVVFTYFVTNPGDTELTPVILSDDNATPGSGDDFAPLPIQEDDGNGTFVNVGDDDGDGRLDPGERWVYQATIVAQAVGQFTNVATVSGVPVDAGGSPLGPAVTDQDPANYVVAGGSAGIAIEKSTNGHDADTAADAAVIAPGETVTWTYTVTNTGQTHFSLAEVVVHDDNGTPQTGDDLSTVDDGNIEITLSDQGDNDGVLEPGEVWTYTATGIAQELVGGPTGDAITVYLTGSSSTSGTVGNARTFTSGGVAVRASAFSRDSGGTWADAYLGAYSSGLGVTDGSEGNGGNGLHRVDNIGRQNYVLFEFSEAVVVDQTFLDSVVHDSDISVWIGSIDGAFTSATNLSDAVLSSLAKERNDTTSASSRWADLNDGQRSGNVLVIAASVDDSTPEDQFKIRKLRFQRTGSGVYSNLGTVSAGGVSDSDRSHYVNPAATNGRIGNTVWNDVDRDGRQDAGEYGLANVTVHLLDKDQQVVATTTTDGMGRYGFESLAAGEYFVRFVAPKDMVFSPAGQGDHADHGSNADSDGLTSKIYLAEGENDNTIDAGLYAAAVDQVFEAEDYDAISSPWRLCTSSAASGGKFLHAPNRTGSHYNSPPRRSKVTYSFDVASSGNYAISGLVHAARSSDNSLWVRIDGGPWVQWHLDLTGYRFQWQDVTDGWDQQAQEFSLTAGRHTMEVRVREDGVRLDKFKVSKLATTTVVLDATQTTTDLDSVAWQVQVDADGNEYLMAPNGSGSHYSTLAGDELRFDFAVSQAGEYRIHALVSALSGNDNSFWIAIDDGQWVQWHLTVTDGAWQWQSVGEGSGGDPLRFDLSEGSHTLKIKVREDGTALDKIVITNDAMVDLDRIG